MYAVIFTSVIQPDAPGYAQMAQAMEEQVARQPGYLGHCSVRLGEVGITVSYWESEADIAHWKHHATHTEARQQGRNQWYRGFRVEVCRVERSYSFGDTSAIQLPGLQGA